MSCPSISVLNCGSAFSSASHARQSYSVAQYRASSWTVASCTPSHPWARRRSGVPPAELAATALVSRESGSGTRYFVEEALRTQAGLEHVPPLAELSSTTAIKAAVAAGAGPAVLSSLAVAAELSAGTLRAVTITGLNLNRTLLAVWAPGRRLAGPARDLYAIAARSARGTRRPG
jgi:DNA-binding transcriptional LysR family regulator